VVGEELLFGSQNFFILLMKTTLKLIVIDFICCFLKFFKITLVFYLSILVVWFHKTLLSQDLIEFSWIFLKLTHELYILERMNL
jgi:hypothetical protein